jgi:hypothetical protein
VDAIARTEVVEAELTRMIEKRSRNGEVDPDTEGELWKESVRRHNLTRSREKQAAWCEYHRHMAQLHEGLAQRHRDELGRLIDGKV